MESVPPALAASDDLIERQGVTAAIAHVELIEPDTHVELLLTVFLKQVQRVIEAGPFGSEVETEVTRPSGHMGGRRVEELPSVNRLAAEIADDIGEPLNPERTDPSLAIHEGGRNSSDGRSRSSIRASSEGGPSSGRVKTLSPMIATLRARSRSKLSNRASFTATLRPASCSGVGVTIRLLLPDPAAIGLRRPRIAGGRPCSDPPTPMRGPP